MESHVKIFDTTLRDGEQAPGCSMNINEKIEVAKQLEILKVDIIEAGFAISSPGDFNSVEAISKAVKNCTVASLARAVQKDIDSAYEAVKNAVSPRIHTFLATSPIHMEHKLKMTPDQVIERIQQSVSYAKNYCSDVQFSAEDATRSEREFLAKAVKTAIDAGANVINIPDTVGYAAPEEMYTLIRYLMETVSGIEKVDVAVHCHNDLGMAVANSLAGVRAGARQVECTVNGLGERAGNAALEEIVMGIKTRYNLYGGYTNIDTKQIYRTSKLIYNVIGQTAAINKPIVGANAFAHEAGIHQHGVLADKSTYEIMIPEEIGITKNKLVLGKHSGKHAIADKLTELGYTFTEKELGEYYDKIMALSDKKKFITDSDIDAIVTNRRRIEGVYKLVHFDVHTTKNATSTCVIKLMRENEEFEEVSLGQGPINAAYNAIDKITGSICEEMSNYNIHSVSDGNDALGEVTVKLKAKDKTVTGRGLSTDIIESSILAYINGINKLLEII
ncbi:MAG: 2-isopropylmalate synthase [Clostridiales bacterium GWF2_38_85]|nr:MAG: 2-isopropylmalate synthase [Clostridiales bacterium GWF2_38_85]HBL83644.1 2-isopropylmalate synthase [Clostridiales bacterium]